MEITLTDASFQKDVMESQTPVLVDFWAPWCTPCRAMGPILEEVAKEFAGKLVVAKMNVDEHAEVSGKFNVMSIPTMLIVKNGTVVDQMIGALPKAALVERLEKALS